MDLDKLKIDRGATKKRGVRRRSRLPGLVVVAAALGALWLFRRPLTELVDRLRLPEVSVVTAARTSPLAASAVGGTAANGYVVAAKRAALSADTPGRVVELNVVEGSFVREGDVVARLFSEEFEAALSSAEASVSAARAGVVRADAEVRAAERENERRRAEVEAARARIESARADLDLARKELGRQRDLVEKGVASVSMLDTAVAAEERWRAMLAAERGGLAATEAALSEGEARLALAQASRVEAEAQVAVAEAVRDQARATLEKTNVRAPFDGVVVLKDAEVGEVVSPNSQGANSRGSVATLVDLASLEVQIDLPETLLPQVSVDAPARIFLDAFPDRPYTGRILRIWPTANRQKATIELRVGFDAPDERLRPDLGARVVFGEEKEPVADSETLPDRVVIPVSAVVRIDGTDGVFVLERDVVRWRPLVPGGERAGRIVVEEGLAGGERIVDNPPPSLEDGERVRVAEP